MSTMVDTAATTRYVRGFIIIKMESGLEIRFPIAANKRLAHGSPKQLNHIEISPYGLHWPDLGEDLSFRGLLAGDFGQHHHRASLQARSASRPGMGVVRRPGPGRRRAGRPGPRPQIP